MFQKQKKKGKKRKGKGKGKQGKKTTKKVNRYKCLPMPRFNYGTYCDII